MEGERVREAPVAKMKTFSVPNASTINVSMKIDRVWALHSVDEDMQARMVVAELSKRVALAIVNRYLNNIVRTVDDQYIHYKLEIGVFDLQEVPDAALERTPHEQVLVELTGWQPMRTWKWIAEVNTGGVEFLYRQDDGEKFYKSTQMSIWEAVLPKFDLSAAPIDMNAPVPVEKRERFPVAWRVKAP